MQMLMTDADEGEGEGEGDGMGDDEGNQGKNRLISILMNKA